MVGAKGQAPQARSSNHGRSLKPVLAMPYADCEMTELVARHTEIARVTMRGVFESATWPLRKLAWLIEEKVLWRVADALRRRPAYSPSDSDSAYIPAQTDLTHSPPHAEAVTAAGPVARAEPTFPRLRPPLRDLSIALATVAVAIGAGIGIATMLGDDDGTQRPSASAPAPWSEAASESRPDTGPATLQGVAPDFEGSSKSAESSAGAAATDTHASPLQGTNAKPSSIPPGVARNITAMNSARDFAGAFVLYEVGESNAEVRKAFARTATPSLAKALQDRPPRLPDSVRVPTAKVQNVVLGTPIGGENARQLEASVSLLRLGDISELRLTLSLRDGDWLVSEVRG
jgi:hypothetical protein